MRCYRVRSLAACSTTPATYLALPLQVGSVGHQNPVRTSFGAVGISSSQIRNGHSGPGFLRPRAQLAPPLETSFVSFTPRRWQSQSGDASASERASTSSQFNVDKAEPFSSDLYKRLGLEKGAQEHEIKNAFHQLAKKYHPDKNPGDKSAADKFHHIKEAKDILSNQTKRKIYDSTGKPEDAKDPKKYRMRQRARLWFPFILASIAFLGTSLNQKYIQPAQKSRNLTTRYIINFIGIWACTIAFGKFLGSILVAYGHRLLYKDDLMRDIIEHVLFIINSPVPRANPATPAAKTPKINWNDKVFIEIVPEDETVKTAMQGMRLEVVINRKASESTGGGLMGGWLSGGGSGDKSGSASPAGAANTTENGSGVASVTEVEKLEPNCFHSWIPLSSFANGQVELTLKTADDLVVATRKITRAAVGLPEPAPTATAAA